MADPFAEAAKRLQQGQQGSADPFAAAADKMGIQRPKGDLPKDAPRRAVDMGLSAIPSIMGQGADLISTGTGIPGALAAGGVSALAGGAGAAIEQGLRYMTGVNPSEHPFQEIKKEAITQGAASIGGSFVLGALKKVFGSYLNSKELYQKALKPSGTSETKAAQSVSAGIRHGVELTPKPGLPGEARKIWMDINNSVERVITNSPADIPPSRYVASVQGKLDAMRSKWKMSGTKGSEYVAQIDDMERDFLINHGNVQPMHVQTQVPGKVLGPNGQPQMTTQTVTIEPKDMSLGELRRGARPMTTGDAQSIKKATYEAIRTQKGTAYDSYVHSGLGVRVNQEIAQGLKEELEHVYPQLKGLNKDMGEVIELEKQLNRFVKREFNKQATPYFIFPTVGGLVGSGHKEGGMMAMAAHMVRSTLEDPGIKSRVAILLDKVARMPGAATARKVGKTIPAGAIRVGAEYKKYIDRDEQ